MTDFPDYTTMTGAQFQSAVGADPEKWAMAFTQDKSPGLDRGSPEHQELLRKRAEEVLPWFCDFADAVRREASLRLDWD